MRDLILLCILVCSFGLFAQDRPQNGIAPSELGNYILKNATIYVSSSKVIQKGTIVIEQGVIKEIGANILKSGKYIEVDCDGAVILPAFIELNYDLATPPSTTDLKGYENRSSEYAWNEAIMPERIASQFSKELKLNEADLAKKGFGVIHIVPTNGIMSGQSFLQSIYHASTNSHLIKDQVSTVFSFEKGTSKQSYPSSQMGSIALIRQTLYDAKWYAQSNGASLNLSLQALNESLKRPVFFRVKDGAEVLRAQKIIQEFDLNAIIVGGGDEYKYVDQLKKMNAKVILPLNFPMPYNVNDPYVNQYIPLSELKHWELAPANAYMLKKNAVPFALSAKGVASDKEFWNNLRSAIKHGLSPMDALKALTETPASWLQIEKDFGTLEVGKKANLVVYTQNPFQQEAEVLEVHNNGSRVVIKNKLIENLDGKYHIQVDQRQLVIEISKKGNQYEAKRLEVNKSMEKVRMNVVGNDVQLAIYDSLDTHKGFYLLHGKFVPKMGVLEGEGTAPSGAWFKWTGIKQKKTTNSESKTSSSTVDTSVVNNLWFPNMAYGQIERAEAKSYAIKNVTIWTNETEGQIRNGLVVVKDGKIQYVGPDNGKVPNDAEVIDGSGKYLTSGIIDEHSHIAISKGVNEGGQSITSEVSIADVVRNDDINIYRQLAGGVTTSQLLHGSANTIGGQSALIKLKWGYPTEELLVKDAPKFIKFALGENVKQTNWNAGAPRFPNTRMGVEQVLVDAFSRAQAYKAGKIGRNAKEGRTDLELEALVEILDGKRFITCHSYIQSEINMLMKVADSFGFKVNTFTHILEGYKLADKMRTHGAGASTFADWWAYKYEVLDAIPYNAALMNEQGLVVAINSDDAEMGRRLNQEAAKAMKYGGMTEEDAWKMVTLNPAKLLHVDDRLGSIKVGKDADLVLWSDNPLTIYAIPENVWIDGTLFFSRSNDLRLQIENDKERARLIAKMLQSNQQSGEKGRTPEVKEPQFFHCNTIGEEGSTEHNEH